MVRYMLKRSMNEDKVITIIYNSDKGITQRDIIVQSIKDDKVFGYCMLRKEWRAFKIENILSAMFPKNKFDRRVS